jgi:D-glycero-alpha-D-manno-heptose-7-phosphate kinase
MIVAKTPLRIPLAGGLSDLAPYAERFGGETVSVTIDKHVYVTVKDDLDGRWDVRYRDSHERTARARELRHDLLRESLELLGLRDRPIDVDFRVDLAGESGLGTSGALTVSVLHALHRLRGDAPDAWTLLHEAARVEVEMLAGASGFHDPAICALGGLRHLGYDGTSVRDLELRPAPGTREAFDDALLLFYSGRHAKSKPSLDLLTSHLDEALPVLHDIRALAGELAGAFTAGDLAGVAHAVAEQQRLKQRLPGRFVDAEVEEVVARVAATGAAAQLPGGKISAFVLVVCPDGQQAAVREALADLREVPVRTTDEGTRALAI